MSLSLKDFTNYNTPFLIAAVFLNATINYFFLQSDSLLIYLIIPGLSWGICFSLPVIKFLGDKLIHLLLFVTANLVLWATMFCIGLMTGAELYKANPFVFFPLLGGFSSVCSYFVYSRLLLKFFSYKDVLICFCAGYISFVLNGLTEVQGKKFLADKSMLFMYWQVLTGLALVIAYCRRMNRIPPEIADD